MARLKYALQQIDACNLDINEQYKRQLLNSGHRFPAYRLTPKVTIAVTKENPDLLRLLEKGLEIYLDG